MTSFDAMVAFATPPGRSALAVCRVSGPESNQVVSQLFVPASSRFPQVEAMAPYSLAYGTWYSSKDRHIAIDEVVLACFRAPHSYTGEDSFEISCHGSPVIKAAILRSLVGAGARLAEPGEFSKQAFLNGKMDLAEAEAVMELIEAKGERASLEALSHLQGQYGNKLSRIQSAIYHILADLEVFLEYGEEDLGVPNNPADLAQLHAEDQAKRDHLAVLAAESLDDLRTLTKSKKAAQYVFDGIKVVLTGKTNAGKSSLLNALLEEDRAIVSDQAGTTRDLITAMTDFEGIPVCLTDTAGLRLFTDPSSEPAAGPKSPAVSKSPAFSESPAVSEHPAVSESPAFSEPLDRLKSLDPLELEGIRRAKESLTTADLILVLLSSTEPAEIEAFQRLTQDLPCPTLYLVSKQDLPGQADLLQALQEANPALDIQGISARNPKDMPALRHQILAQCEALPTGEEAGLLVHTERHLEALQGAIDALDQAKSGLKNGLSWDLISALLRSALDSLASITGENVSLELIDQIFSSFCVGK